LSLNINYTKYENKHINIRTTTVQVTKTKVLNYLQKKLLSLIERAPTNKPNLSLFNNENLPFQKAAEQTAYHCLFSFGLHK